MQIEIGPLRRSIPACAGEPLGANLSAAPTRVYPRVCGGATSSIKLYESGDGLSPRVRGSQPSPARRRIRQRSIPACAGEPGSGSSSDPVSGVYPRVCGGALSACSTIGITPRSIPACAGEPSQGSYAYTVRPVYPRVCGGACPRQERPGLHWGLSPRVRGSLIQSGMCPDSRGSYPRVCGGAMAAVARGMVGKGLSPRVRGSPKPTCGKTLLDEVYPRVCGGAGDVPWNRVAG